jgi:ATP-dependent RNA helicase DDX52/ROK1
MLNQQDVKFKLDSVEWLVIDEADKLFEDGKQSFREQLSTIYKACDSPLIKHAMFSATYTHAVEEWSTIELNNVIQVSIGRKNVATYSVEQELAYVGNEAGKLFTLRSLFKKGFDPPILVFVQSKERARDLFKELIYDGINVDVINSERTQQQV